MADIYALAEVRPESERALNSRLQLAIRDMGLQVLSEQPVPPITFVNKATGTLLVTNGVADLVVETYPGIFAVIECKRGFTLANLDGPTNTNPLRQLGDYINAYKAQFQTWEFYGVLVAPELPPGCPAYVDGIHIRSESAFLKWIRQ